MALALKVLAIACLLWAVSSLRGHVKRGSSVIPVRGERTEGKSFEYSNPITKVLESFLPSPIAATDTDKGGKTKKKRRKTSLKSLAKDFETALSGTEWFVTGQVDSTFFSDDFRFQDPDVKVSGIGEYAKGVNKLFDQSCTRGEVISCKVNSTVPNTITVTWRLEGKVNIGGGVKIKAFIVYTNLLVDETSGLITFQEDKFSLPSYDILLSAFFPFLYRDLKLLAPPAPAAAFLREAMR